MTEFKHHRAGIDATGLDPRWPSAVIGALLLGGLFAFLAGDRVPIPVPVPGVSPTYWIGWSPLTGLALLLYLLRGGGLGVDRRRYLIGGAGIAVVTVGSALNAWEATEDVALITAIHLPLVVWMIVGWTVSGTRPISDQLYPYLLKSVETLIAAGLFLIAGVIFGGLTLGVFRALGVELPGRLVSVAAASGLGATPLLALAMVFDPTRAPRDQDWSRGLAGIQRIIPRLLVPAALGVLLVYVLWFIPNQFWRPFEDRTALVVFNLTIVAIVALTATALPGYDEEQNPRLVGLLRRALLAMGLLTVLLNAYALTAGIWRIMESGLTPNRHVLLGWNVVTLALMTMMTATLWRAGPEWVSNLRRTLVRMMVPSTFWALWVLWIVAQL